MSARSIFLPPALQDHAESQAYRDGKRRLVRGKIPLVENSLELQLRQMLQETRRSARGLWTQMQSADHITSALEALETVQSHAFQQLTLRSLRAGATG